MPSIRRVCTDIATLKDTSSPEYIKPWFLPPKQYTIYRISVLLNRLMTRKMQKLKCPCTRHEGMKALDEREWPIYAPVTFPQGRNPRWAQSRSGRCFGEKKNCRWHIRNLYRPRNGLVTLPTTLFRFPSNYVRESESCDVHSENQVQPTAILCLRKR